MAYVRHRGNQLAIVHGERDPESGKVEQQVLFTLFSKAEALAALGKSGESNPRYFQMLLEDEYPNLKFNWKAIYSAISASLEHLPDLYEYRRVRIQDTFRKDLCAFLRQLASADPQSLHSAALLLQENRQELEFLIDLIQWRLETCDQEKDELNTDTPFYWRFVFQKGEVPPDLEEQAAELYEKGEYKRAFSVFRLLTEAFKDYAEGYNYLGLICLRTGDLKGAISYFEKTVEVGRRLFPKRIKKERYWNDLSTRPYMRGLRNLTLTLNRAARFDEALKGCERLEKECGDFFSAAAHRASIYLNTRRWREALEFSRKLHESSPAESFTAAFASFELGELSSARAFFLHGLLNLPISGHMLIGEKYPKPKSSEEIEDYNNGIETLGALSCYIRSQNRKAKLFFRELIRHSKVIALQQERVEVTRKWREDRSNTDRKAFGRMIEMQRPEFASKVVESHFV
jgi:tetratricopeptide (TPR) repeat protein